MMFVCLYSRSKISSDEPVSVPRSGIESIWWTLNEYLPIMLCKSVVCIDLLYD